MRVGIFGIERNRAAILANGLVALTAGLQRIGEIEVHAVVVRLQPHGGSELLRGIAEAPQQLKGDAAIAVRFRVLWLQPKRFVELGRTIRQLVESWPDDKRVAIIGTGHLSLELGGPRQFGEHGPDPEFDRRAVDWIASGDLEGCLAEVTLDSLHQPGNATHGFMDFMLMMGVAGEGAKADHVDSLDLFHTMEAYFTWYPNGAPTP